MNHVLLKKVTEFQRPKESPFPRFNVGDRISISVLVKEGKKDRIQKFEALVIAMRGTLNNRTFLVRRDSGTMSIERVFYLYSPLIKDIKIISSGRVRRAKLYFIRKLKGKAARLRNVIKRKKIVP